MPTEKDISLREYLHLQERRVNAPCIDAYDEFLLKVWEFFSLRAAAEDNFIQNPHLAKSKHGALPITWEQMRETWRKSSPPEQIITQIAKRHCNEVKMILGNLSKDLNRVRQKVALGRVQQVDSHCLRWLTRQPGVTPAEKGGARQEILGVVRVENYDTLENRVLKDSKIWADYMTVLRQEDVAERLWEQRTTVDELYDNCVNGIETNCSPRAKYRTPLWINELDGHKPIFENPVWENELGDLAIVEPSPPTEEVQIVSFSFPWDNRNELVYPTAHRNARPFLQNPHLPSKEPGNRVSLASIIEAPRIAFYRSERQCVCTAATRHPATMSDSGLMFRAISWIKRTNLESQPPSLYASAICRPATTMICFSRCPQISP